MLTLAAAESTTAGLITASATVIIALGGLVTAVSVLIPILRKTTENSVAIAENQKVTTAKLGVIHTLVNSTLTAALQSELDATRREELLLRELVRMREDAGHPVSDDQLAALGATQRKIHELAAAMDERHDQTRQANIQIETEHARQVHT
jgi:hypothetical protein